MSSMNADLSSQIKKSNQMLTKYAESIDEYARQSAYLQGKVSILEKRWCTRNMEGASYDRL